MPVRTVGVVEQRHRAVRAVLELHQKPEEVAAHCGVHPDTVRRWVKRFLDAGLEGLADKAKTPWHSPARMAPEMEERICAMRSEHPHWGPRRIRAELLREARKPPARSTIGKALERNGFIVPAAPRPKPVLKRFVAPAPNAVWQIDAYEVALADGTKVEVIDILDDHARMIMGLVVVAVVNGEAAWTLFEATAARYGLPQKMLMDNAGYFTGRLQGFVAEFERRLWRLGVATIHGSPRHPQTQGKIERIRRTVRAWLARQAPATTIAELQAQLEVYVEHYNYDRPHQGLNDQLPGDVYAATAPASPDPFDPPCRKTLRKVDQSGVLRYSGWSVNVGSEWIGWQLEVIEQADKVRVIYGAELITSFSTEMAKGYIPSGRLRGGRRRPRMGDD